MRGLVLAVVLLPSLASAQSATDSLPPIESVFPLKWAQRVGQTTFRTNLLATEGYVLAPSNGVSRNNLLDPDDGLWVLSGTTGEVVYRIHPTGAGDTDVNGLALDGRRLYFGNDLGQVFCTSISGKEHWQVALEGDIEGSPVLVDVNRDGTLDCVVATEDPATLVALDGTTGAKLWSFTPRDYGTFMATPLAYDLTGDGLPDYVIGLAGGRSIFAVNGATGRQMWRYQTLARAGLVDGSAVHASATLITESGKPPLILAAEVHGQLHYITPEGRADRFLSAPTGLFSSPIVSPRGTVILGASWQGKGSIHLADAGPDDHWKEGSFAIRTLLWKHYHSGKPTGRVSASASIADVLADSTWQLLIPTEDGQLQLFTEDGTLLHRLRLPAGAEASCLVADVDGDGTLELLIATLDGYLRCYATRGTQVFWGSFRGGPHNLGVWPGGTTGGGGN